MASMDSSIIVIAITLLTGSLRTTSYADDSTTSSGDVCTSYSAKLKSIPDLKHMIVYKPRQHHNFEITEVKSTNYQRSFYWCELEIQETDTLFKRYRHFGFNSTHWWVEKGCGGWFWVTECKSRPRDSSKLPSVQEEADSETTWDDSKEVTQTTWQDFPTKTINSNDHQTSGNSQQTQTSSDLAFGNRKADEKTAQGVTRLTDGSRKILDVSMPPGNDSDGVISHKRPESSGTSWIDDLYRTWPKEGYHFPSSPAMWDWLDNLTSTDVAAQMGFYNRHVDRTSL